MEGDEEPRIESRRRCTMEKSEDEKGRQQDHLIFQGREDHVLRVE